VKKIIVPTDFSKSAILASKVAGEIAKKANAELILLHVIEVPSTESFNAEAEVEYFKDWDDKVFTKKLIELSKKQLALSRKEIELKDVEVTCKLKMGNIFHGIRTTISSENADLVVMGISNKSKLEEMLIGSNAEKVIRHAKCPVLTVHEKLSRTDFKNIVYATSLRNDEKAFSDVIINAQEMFGATIHLVRINTPKNFTPDTEVRKKMESFASSLHLRNYTLNIFNDYTEEEGIIHFADNINADLIAMATHGRTGFAHVISGSIAEDVANHTSRPVLTYVTNDNN
jgi:nucleotide-binding universal stress UspA family protein